MLHHYSLLKGVIAKDLEEHVGKERTHHNLVVLAGDVDYQVNIDVQSLPRPNVKIFVKSAFEHPVLVCFDSLPENSLTSLQSYGCDYHLDYLRHKILSPEEMAQTPVQEARKISEILDAFLHEGTSVFILGDLYNDETPSRGGRPPHGLDLRNTHHFLPARGIHQIHMNQGVPKTMAQSIDNGIFQDGAIFIKQPDQTFQAFFFVFDNQCATTDEGGNCLSEKRLV